MGHCAHQLSFERPLDAAVFTVVADGFNVLQASGNNVEPVWIANDEYSFGQVPGFGF